MHSVPPPADFADWRDTARGLLAAGHHPDEVLWEDAQSGELFGSTVENLQADPKRTIPKAFLDMARSAAAHRDPRRWGLLYQLLWRITHGEPHLMALSTDPQLRQAQRWVKAVGRDIHKLHAFVRFRKVGEDEATGRENFVAWYEPDHFILPLGAPFFHKRFASMNWSILTPDACVHWNGERMEFTAGVDRSEAPDEDSLDDLWRTYYRHIFNPARLKVKMMESQMPKKFWRNLPEAEIIHDLVSNSQNQVKTMLETEERPVKPAPKNAYLQSLHRMNKEALQAEDEES